LRLALNSAPIYKSTAAAVLTILLAAAVAAVVGVVRLAVHLDGLNEACTLLDRVHRRGINDSRLDALLIIDCLCFHSHFDHILLPASLYKHSFKLLLRSCQSSVQCVAESVLMQVAKLLRFTLSHALKTACGVTTSNCGVECCYNNDAYV
jgi:hypothetical protein